MNKLCEKEKENAVNEVRILASIDHINVIAYKEAFFDDTSNSLIIVMEFAQGGDLLNKIEKHQTKKTRFSDKELWSYMIQSLRGLKALHDQKICHRDIKVSLPSLTSSQGANLFITNDGIIKLGDLNVSKVQKSRLMHTQTGTPYYTSPEVWKDKPYDNKCDIWSLGCVLYELAALHPPFRGNSMKALCTNILKGSYPSLSKKVDRGFQKMLAKMLQLNPSSRPTA